MFVVDIILQLCIGHFSKSTFPTISVSITQGEVGYTLTICILQLTALRIFLNALHVMLYVQHLVILFSIRTVSYCLEFAAELLPKSSKDKRRVYIDYEAVPRLDF